MLDTGQICVSVVRLLPRQAGAPDQLDEVHIVERPEKQTSGWLGRLAARRSHRQRSS